MTRALVTSHVLIAGMVAAFSTACGSSGESAPPPAVAVPAGSLTLDWTINGTKDPAQCAQGAATDLDVTVETLDGAFVGEFQGACEDFATRIDLAPGDYRASALLIGADGTDRTTPIAIDPFSIQGADNLVIPIDFPASSFR